MAKQITEGTVKKNLEECRSKWHNFYKDKNKYQALIKFDEKRIGKKNIDEHKEINNSINNVLDGIKVDGKGEAELAIIDKILDDFKKSLNKLEEKIEISIGLFSAEIIDGCAELRIIYEVLKNLEDFIIYNNIINAGPIQDLSGAINKAFGINSDAANPIAISADDKWVLDLSVIRDNYAGFKLCNEICTIYVFKRLLMFYENANRRDICEKCMRAIDIIEFYENPKQEGNIRYEFDEEIKGNFVEIKKNTELNQSVIALMQPIYKFVYEQTGFKDVSLLKKEELETYLDNKKNKEENNKKRIKNHKWWWGGALVFIFIFALLMGRFVTPIIQNQIEVQKKAEEIQKQEQKKLEEIQLFETAKTAWENVLQYDSTGTIITGASSCVENATELIIPATHKGKAVVGIEAGAFEDENKYANITSVMIPSTIKSIGEEAFAGCNISSDTNGIKVIGTSQSSFANYLNEDIYESANWIVGNENETLPNLTYSEIVGIADGALKASEERTTENTITIQLGGLKYVGKDAFANRNEIKAIQTSETKGDLSTIEIIGSSAFANCNNLGGIAIHNEKVAIAEDAFSDCGNLVKVTYKNGNDVVLVGTYDKAKGVICPTLESDFKSSKIDNKTGYSFTAWSLDGENAYQFGHQDGLPNEIVLQALFTAKNYKIYIDSNGGYEVAPIEVTYDSSYEIDVVPTRTGYTFNKYTLNGEDYVISEKYQEPKDITLKAEWNAIDYNINYNLNGGTNNPNNPSRYTIESSITLNEPTRTGYTFSGWTYSGQSTPIKNVTIPKGTTGERTFTANWKFKSITITGQNSNELKITDEGRWGLTQEKYDEIDISSLSSYFNAGFKFKIKIKITAKEENHGYQEIFMYNKLEIVNNKTAVSLNEDIVRRDYGLLYYKSFECGGTELDTTYDDYIFTFELNGKDCRNKMYVRYDAYDGGNQSEDTWYKGSLYYEIVVDEV